MRDYYKYCTVGELKDQIKATLVSAKSKLTEVSESRKHNDPSFLHQKFYTYVNEIKSKQQQYDSLMNKTNEIELLLNRRRKRINESLEKYEKNKRSKTLTSFYHPQRINQSPHASAFQNSLMAISTINAHARPFYETQIVQKSRGRYETEPTGSADIGGKSVLMEMIQNRGRPTLKTEPEGSKELGLSKNLRSVTNVVNIRIGNQENYNTKYNKLYSFTKGSVNEESKGQHQQIKGPETQLAGKNPQEQAKMADMLSIQSNVNNYGSVGNYDSGQPQKKRRTESTLVHKVIKLIKGRIKANQEMAHSQWQQNKTVKLKTVILKHQYEAMLRRDVKLKVAASREIYHKIKEVGRLK